MTTFSDNFTRTDGNLGLNWSPVINNHGDNMFNSNTGGLQIHNFGYGPIAAGGGDACSLVQQGSFGNDQWARAVVKTVAPYTATLAITAAVQSGTNTTYSYTVTQGSVTDVISGGELYVIITGMADAGNNGTFTAATFGPGTFTVINHASGVTRAGQSGVGVCPSDAGTGVAVRLSGTNSSNLSGYFFHIGTNSYGGGGRRAYYELWKIVNGVGTILGQSNDGSILGNRLPVVGDVIAISAVGTTITAYLNGAVCAGGISAFQVTDSSVASGVPGVWSWCMNGPQEYVWANWNTVVNPPGNNAPTMNKFTASDVGTPFTTPTETQLGSDSFAYANGDLHTLNANWVYDQNSFTVSSNKVFDSHAGNSSAYRADISPSADQYSKVTAVVGTNATIQNCGPAVRMAAGAATYYCLQYANNTFQISKCVNGTFTILSPNATAVHTGDTVALYVIGNTLIGVLNGIVINSAVDADITSGYAGIFSADAAINTLNGFSAWSCGNASVIPPDSLFSQNPAFPTGGVLMVPPFPSGGVSLAPPPPSGGVLMSPPPPTGGVLEYPDQYPFPAGGVKLWPS